MIPLISLSEYRYFTVDKGAARHVVGGDLPRGYIHVIRM